MTKAALEALVNALLAPSQPISANGMHKPSMQHVINEMYDAPSRGAVLSGVTDALSLNTGDKVFVIRSGEARLINQSAFEPSGGGGGAAFVDQEIPTGIVDGDNDTFTTSSVPLAGSEYVYIDGLLMDKDVDYTIVGQEITFVDPPATAPRVSYRISGGEVVIDHFRGAHSLSGNAYPSSGGSGAGGAIQAGDVWYVSVTGNLDLGSGPQSIPVRSLMLALVNTPGSTSSNWRVDIYGSMDGGTP